MTNETHSTAFDSKETDPMSRTERMRAALAANPAPATTPPIGGSGTAPPKTPKPEKPTPGPQVVFKCGCKVAVRYMENVPCPGCVRANRVKRNAEKRAAREAKGEPKSAVPDAGRLPEGAVFHATYDAAKQEWTGSLELLNGFQFTATESGVFKLLRQLDTLYRQSLAAEGK